MTLPTIEQLNTLSREELIALLIALMAEYETLRAEVDRLKQPPATSRNSSQPPSRDRKGNRAAGKKRKKHGAQAGHVKAERALVENPDHVLEVRVTSCTACGADLQAVVPLRTLRRQVTELPEIKPVVIETRQDEVLCPCCQRTQRGVLPEGLEAQRQVGPRLEAAVVYLHHEQHLSFARLQTLLHDLFGVTLSEGGEVAIVERAGVAAQPEAQAIGERVRRSAVIGSDETSARVNGCNWWEWVFESEAGEYHLIVPSRGHAVIEAFMAEHVAEVWLSDCWSPQLHAPAVTHQLCLPHQIRALQGLIDKRPCLRWAYDMQDLFRSAIHLHHRCDALTPAGFKAQVTLLTRRLDRLLNRRVTGIGANLLKRYRTHRQQVFVFLQRSDVSPDNNACERALRPSVIHRKVLGSFRSEWGARAYAALTTVLHTAKRAGHNVFHKLVDLMGTPVLHYLHSSIL